MRPALAASLLVAAALAAGVVAAVSGSGVHAQDAGATLYVSGLEVGRGDRAVVRLRNAAASAGDVFSVHYTVRHTEAGQPLTLPGAGDGARLAPGETIELDLGAIVNAYRAALEAGDFTGPVQFVAFGTGGVFRAFGPDTVVVEAIQQDGRATFAPLVEWR